MPVVCVRAVLFFSFPNVQFHVPGVAAPRLLLNVAVKHGDCKDSCDVRGFPVTGQCVVRSPDVGLREEMTLRGHC